MDANSFQALLPEILLVLAACTILLIDLWVRSAERAITYSLTLFTLLGLALLFGVRALYGERLSAFGDMVQTDALANLLKSLAALASALVLVYGRAYVQAQGMLVRGGEFFVLVLFAFLGMCTMISGNNLLVIYLGVELLTLSSYALVALRRDSALATEAAMKYFVLGAMASGFLLYGMSMFYGATGTLNISQMAQAINAPGVSAQIWILGLVFLVAGIAFKFGVAPFHMWIPDVYQGAPTAVVLLLGAAPKFAALAIALRLLSEGLLPLAVDWQQMLGVMAVASLLVGNLAAIAQHNLKRMLAYSTIGQMGFVLLGLSAGVVNAGTMPSLSAYSASLFYTIAYVLTTLATFGVILLLSRKGFEGENIADFAGLNQRNPVFAGVMAACMFSLAGIPMFVGFYAKLVVLQALLATSSDLYLALAVFAVIMSLIGAFYYLRVIKVMYFDTPIQDTPVQASPEVQWVLGANGALVVILGIFPASLMQLSTQALRTSMVF